MSSSKNEIALLGGTLRPRHGTATQILPESFEEAASYYPRVQNSRMHPTVAQFVTMTPLRMAQR
jgi:hypothetical protein